MIETTVQELLMILALVISGRCSCVSHMVWRVHVQLCPTLCVPMDYIAHQALLSTEFSNQETLE